MTPHAIIHIYIYIYIEHAWGFVPGVRSPDQIWTTTTTILMIAKY